MDACFLVVIWLVAMSHIKVTINHYHTANVIFATCVYIRNFNFPPWSHPSPHSLFSLLTLSLSPVLKCLSSSEKKGRRKNAKYKMILGLGFYNLTFYPLLGLYLYVAWCRMHRLDFGGILGLGFYNHKFYPLLGLHLYDAWKHAPLGGWGRFLDRKRDCKMDGTQTFDAEMYILSM